jgi:uncharacterized protein (DUF362 family)
LDLKALLALPGGHGTTHSAVVYNMARVAKTPGEEPSEIDIETSTGCSEEEMTQPSKEGGIGNEYFNKCNPSVTSGFRYSVVDCAVMSQVSLISPK